MDLPRTVGRLQHQQYVLVAGPFFESEFHAVQGKDPIASDIARDIKRFADVGNYASYCRCVGAKKMSNFKKKGEGNRKNGNKYLAWAFVEAAHFAVQANEQIRKFFQRKAAKKNKIVATKAVAHKLARACYHIMKDQTMFDVTKAFA